MIHTAATVGRMRVLERNAEERSAAEWIGAPWRERCRGVISTGSPGGALATVG